MTVRARAGAGRTRPSWLGWAIGGTAAVMLVGSMLVLLWLLMPYWLYGLIQRYTTSTALAYHAAERIGVISTELEQRHGGSAHERAAMLRYIFARMTNGGERARIYAVWYIPFLLRQGTYVLTPEQETSVVAAAQALLSHPDREARAAGITCICAMKRRELIPDLLGSVAGLPGFPDAHEILTLRDFDDPAVASQLIAWSHTFAPSFMLASALAQQTAPDAVARAVAIQEKLPAKQRIWWLWNCLKSTDPRLLQALADACRDADPAIHTPALMYLGSHAGGISHLLILRQDTAMRTLHADIDRTLTDRHRRSGDLTPAQVHEWEAAQASSTVVP